MSVTETSAMSAGERTAWARRGAGAGPRARCGDPRPQLPAAGDPGRRRPRRRLPRAVPRARRASMRRRSCSAACTSWPRRRRSSAPDKTVLIPDERAGCSLADTITADQLREWKAEHPGAVVCQLREHDGGGEGRDGHLLHVVERGRGGRSRSRPTSRCSSALTSSSAPTSSGSPAARTCTSGWASATSTPASTVPTSATASRRSPTPSCSSTPSAAARPARSTSPVAGVVPEGAHQASCRRAAWSRRRRTRRRRKVLVATETGMLHQLTKANPLVIFEPVNRAAVCKYMKMITPRRSCCVRCGRAPTRSTCRRTIADEGSGLGRADDRHRHALADRRVISRSMPAKATPS